MTEPIWIRSDVVIAVHEMLLAEHGGASGIRDEALLDSALNRPRQRYQYTADPDLCELAASYCHGLVRNHPFADGNKRTAFTVAAAFLEINGHELHAPEPEAARTIEQLAAGNVSETRLAQWFAEHTRK